MGPERAAEAVEVVCSDRTTSRAAAKTSDIFVGSLQKRVSGGASIADRVGPGTVPSMSNEKSVFRRRHSTCATLPYS